MDSDIINNTGDFEFVPDQSERLITFEHEHVREKSEYLVKRIKREQAYEENMNVLRTAIATCKQLAEGDQQLIKAFLGLTELKPKTSLRQKTFIPNLM